MAVVPAGSRPDETEADITSEKVAPTIMVRYWAGARAAAGVDHDVFVLERPTTLSDVVAMVLEAHPGPRLAEVLGVCSILVGDQPTSHRFGGCVQIDPGMSIEFLPPFAGG